MKVKLPIKDKEKICFHKSNYIKSSKNYKSNSLLFSVFSVVTLLLFLSVSAGIMNSYLFSELFGVHTLKYLILTLCIFIFATFTTFDKKNKNFDQKTRSSNILIREWKIFFNDNENICEIAIDNSGDNWQYQKIDVDDEVFYDELSDAEWELIKLRLP
jgi:hypothetical protein